MAAMVSWLLWFVFTSIVMPMIVGLLTVPLKGWLSKLWEARSKEAKQEELKLNQIAYVLTNGPPNRLITVVAIRVVYVALGTGGVLFGVLSIIFAAVYAGFRRQANLGNTN